MNKSSITKYVVGGIIVVAFVIYIVFANKSSAPVAVTNNTTSTTGEPSRTGAAASTTGTPSSTDTSGSGTGTTATTGQYKDGTYTGSVADAFYGNIQVAAVIKSGAIVDIKFLQAPGEGHSADVSAMSEPALTQEAIATQSANVNTVSGATQDSVAFNQSLAAALAQAKN